MCLMSSKSCIQTMTLFYLLITLLVMGGKHFVVKEKWTGSLVVPSLTFDHPIYASRTDYWAQRSIFLK